MRCDVHGRRWLLLLAATIVAMPRLAAAQQLDAGDTLHIRLLDRARGHHHAHPVIRAVVIAPVTGADGRTSVPPGSILYGPVAGAGVERFGGKRHWLDLHFDSLAIPVDNPAHDTVRAAIAVRIASVDDSRETVDSAGRIVGPSIPPVFRAKRDLALALLGVLHPAGAVMLVAMFEGERSERHRAISLDEGRELTLVAAGAVELPRWTAWRAPPPVAASVNADSIAATVPRRASLPEGNAPSDLIGLAVIGTASQLRDAFAAAGWTRAAPKSVRSDFMTMLKAAEGEGYSAQPVSALVLGQRPPNAVYEKVADTFLRRHHFRVWRWPALASKTDTTALWLIAATHDTGLMFSGQRHTFTHTVSPRIDLERDKIVSDLVAADRVAALSYVARPAAPERQATAGSRRAAITDGRMAVLVLK